MTGTHNVCFPVDDDFYSGSDVTVNFNILGDYKKSLNYYTQLLFLLLPLYDVLYLRKQNRAAKTGKWRHREKGKMLHIAKISLTTSNFLEKIRKLILTRQVQSADGETEHCESPLLISVSGTKNLVKHLNISGSYATRNIQIYQK